MWKKRRTYQRLVPSVLRSACLGLGMGLFSLTFLCACAPTDPLLTLPEVPVEELAALSGHWRGAPELVQDSPPLWNEADRDIVAGMRLDLDIHARTFTLASGPFSQTLPITKVISRRGVICVLSGEYCYAFRPRPGGLDVIGCYGKTPETEPPSFTLKRE